MPRGIFGNTQEIYAEVASYPVVPPEKIKQYWTGIWTLPPSGVPDPAAVVALTPARQFTRPPSEDSSTPAHSVWRTSGGTFGGAIGGT